MKTTFLLLFFSSVLPQFLAFITHIYFRKNLPVEFFGVWSFLNVIIANTCFLFTPVRNTVDWKGPELERGYLSPEKRILLLSSLSLVSIIALVISGVSLFYFQYYLNIQDKFLYYLAFISVIIIQRGLRPYFELIFRNEEWFALIYKLRFGFDILLPVCQFILVLIFGWRGVLLGIVLISVAYLLSLLIICSKKLSFRVDFNKINLSLFKDNIKSVFTSGGIVLAASILTSISFTMDQILINYYFGTAQLGLYSFAIFFMDKCILIAGPLIMIYRPSFFEWYSKNSEHKVGMAYDKLNTYLSKTIFLIVLIQGVAISFMPIIINSFFKKYIPISNAFIILSIVPIFRFTPEIINILLTAKKEFVKLIYIIVATLILEIGVYTLILYFFSSILAVSAAVLITSIAYYAIYLVMVIREERHLFYNKHKRVFGIFFGYLSLLATTSLCEVDLFTNTIFYLVLTACLLRFASKEIFNIKSFLKVLKSKTS